MNSKTAEVYYRLGEFVSQEGLWYVFCDDAADLYGITPNDIASALNHAAVQSGRTGDLTPEDCR